MIKKILDEIASESSTNKKLEIIKSYKDNETFKRVLYLAYSKRIKFYIKQIPERINPSISTITLEDGLSRLEVLYNRIKTGGDASDWLCGVLSNLSKDDAIVIERIIGKDLKIGTGVRSIDKCIPGLIERTPYMGAQPYDIKKVKKLFENNDFLYADVKMDGRYNNVIIRGGEVEMESRSGETVLLGDALVVKELANFSDCVLNGELTIADMDNRYKANGIITSIIDIYSKVEERGKLETNKKKEKFQKENGAPIESFLDRILYTVWDRIEVDEYFDMKSNDHYFNRWRQLCMTHKEVNPTMVQLVEKKEVKTYEEGMEFFQECLNRGLEGIILKSPYGLWVNKKPDYQIKMKLEMEIELRIRGFNLGSAGTKNENVYSSIECVSEDSLLVTNPGGINEDMMAEITLNKDKYMDKIITVKANGISKSRTGEYSLLHPRFICFREDKDVANTLQEALDIQGMCKGLNK